MLAMLSLNAAGQLTAILEIREQVTVNGPNVLLSDFAVDPSSIPVECEDPVMTKAPSVGTPKTFSLVELASRMQCFSELLDLTLKGPESITVTRQINQNDMRRIRQAVLSKLAESEPWKDWEIDLLLNSDDERKLGNLVPPVDLEILPLDSSIMLGSVPMLVISVNEQGERTSECRISPVVLRQVRAVTMKRPRERGTVLAEKDLKLSPVWAEGTNKRYVTDMDRCVGRELSRRLIAGELVREDHLLSPVCVRRGGSLWVTCRSAGMLVRMSAIALETGREGEIVRVRNPVSLKEFKAQLIGNKKALFVLDS